MVGSARPERVDEPWSWSQPDASVWDPQPERVAPRAGRPGLPRAVVGHTSRAADSAPGAATVRLLPAATRPGRRVTVLVAALTALLCVLGLGSPALADPSDPDGQGDNGLIAKLEEAAKAYYDTQAVLNTSQQRQAELQRKVDTADVQLAQLSEEIGKVAAARYKGGSIGLFNGLLEQRAQPSDLLNGAAVNQYLIWHDDTYIREYRQVKEDSDQQSALLKAEVDLQSQQLAILDQQKRDAEKALEAVGGMVSDGVPAISTGTVQPAPRNSAGGFSKESCTQTDPTTQRCITPRTYHMLIEAQLAGFKRYTACYRPADSGEHPLGRACDFSVTQNGFVDAVASGDPKDYGNKLAAWAVANASALGVLYVIWFRQIWTPAAGWHHYTPVGDPATEHTNHVHISMY